MIKVNLLRSRAEGVGEETFAVSGQGGAASSLSKSDQIEVIKKVLVASLATLGLFVYEWYNVDVQSKRAITAQAEVQAVERKLKAVNDELANYKDVQDESKILEDKISILKALSKVRLREVKSLDFLQSITPEAVWYQEVEYRDAVFKLEGYAITDDALSQLIKELEKSIYFTDVILMKANESKQPSGTVKAFSIQANIGDGR